MNESPVQPGHSWQQQCAESSARCVPAPLPALPEVAGSSCDGGQTVTLLLSGLAEMFDFFTNHFHKA